MGLQMEKNSLVQKVLRARLVTSFALLMLLVLASEMVGAYSQGQVQSRCDEIWQEVESEIPLNPSGQIEWIEAITHQWPNEFWSSQMSIFLESTNSDVRVLAAIKLLELSPKDRSESRNTLLEIIKKTRAQAVIVEIQRLTACGTSSSNTVVALAKLARGGDVSTPDEPPVFCMFRCKNSSITKGGDCNICGAPMIPERDGAHSINIAALEALSSLDITAAREIAVKEAFVSTSYISRIHCAGVWARTGEEAAITYLRLLVTQGDEVMSRPDIIGYVSNHWAEQFRSELLTTFNAGNVSMEGRVMAAIGLSSVDSDEVTGTLRQAVESGPSVVRSLSFQGLAMHGDKEDLILMGKYLDGDDRFYAAAAIARLVKTLKQRALLRGIKHKR